MAMPEVQPAPETPDAARPNAPVKRRMWLSPLNQRRWRNFRRNGRAYWSLIIFSVLFGLSLFGRLFLGCRFFDLGFLGFRLGLGLGYGAFGSFCNLGYDVVYLHRCKFLAVSLLAAKPFAAFVFKNDNLFGFALFYNMSLNRDTVEYGLPDADVFSIRKHQHPVKGYRTANFPGQFLNS